MAALNLSFGPVYCEDAFAFTSFPIEPVNTLSNLAIVMFGVFALKFTARTAPQSTDLKALGWLLVANGIGSGLWHGLREPWALGFDVLPGLLFLFAFSFCWARRLWSLAAAVSLAVVFALAFALSGLLFPSAPRFLPVAPVVIVTAAVLITQTAMRSKPAAWFGGAALAGALTALLFRTIDIASCPYIPVGTHFLWHIFNSAGAFMGVIALVTLQRAAPTPAVSAVLTDHST